MLIYEYKLDARKEQYAAIDNAIRICQFIRNKCIRVWMDEYGVSKNDLQVYCSTLASQFDFAKSLNSQARQASADRAWFAISRFCQVPIPWNGKGLHLTLTLHKWNREWTHYQKSTLF